MTIKLPNLPYEQDALEPHISAETLALHHGKHHKGYVDETNKLIEGSPLDDAELVEIISHARERAAIPLLNNSQQAWNHTFLWQSMTPNGAIAPEGRILQLVKEAYGDVDRFKAKFEESATGQFGSGWTWLVLDGSKLEIMSTSNADSPVATHLTPLLTLDVWEHAYYVDYRNERAKYVDTFLDHLINWKFALQNLESLSQAA